MGGWRGDFPPGLRRGAAPWSFLEWGFQAAGGGLQYLGPMLNNMRRSSVLGRPAASSLRPEGVQHAARDVVEGGGGTQDTGRSKGGGAAGAKGDPAGCAGAWLAAAFCPFSSMQRPGPPQTDPRASQSSSDPAMASPLPLLYLCVAVVHLAGARGE